MIELSSYLSETLDEAERLLSLKSRLGRLPLSKKNEVFRKRFHELVDSWFESEQRLSENEVGQCRVVVNPLVGAYPESECLEGLSFSDETATSESGNLADSRVADFDHDDERIPF